MQPSVTGRPFAFLVIISVATAAFCTASLATQSSKPNLYYMRKSFCEKEAAAMHFGVHRLKRYRYIRKCLAETLK